MHLVLPNILIFFFAPLPDLCPPIAQKLTSRNSITAAFYYFALRAQICELCHYKAPPLKSGDGPLNF